MGTVGAVLAAGCALAGCVADGPAAVTPTPPSTTARVPAGSTVALTAADDGAGTAITLGGTLHVSLRDPSGSRGQWKVTAGRPQLHLVGSSSTSGTQVLTFRGTKAGETTLWLEDASGHRWHAVVAVVGVHFTSGEFGPARPGVHEGSTTSSGSTTK